MRFDIPALGSIKLIYMKCNYLYISKALYVGLVLPIAIYFKTQPARNENQVIAVQKDSLSVIFLTK